MTDSVRSLQSDDAAGFGVVTVPAWAPQIAVSSDVSDHAAVKRFAEQIESGYTAPAIRFDEAQPLTVMGKHFAVISERAGLVRDSIHTIATYKWHQAFALVRHVSLHIGEEDVALVAASSGSDNYFHWLAETIGTALLHRTLFPGARIPLVLPTIIHQWQRQALDLFDIDNRIIEVGTNDAAVFDSAVMTNMSARDYGFFPHPAIVRQFSSQLPPHKVAPSGSDLVYLARLDAGGRRTMTNETELCAALERRGFKILVPSRCSVAEQAGALTAAKLVVAPHGAALGSLFFCGQGAAGPRVIELQQEAYLSRNFAKLCQANSLDYSAVVSAQTNRAEYHHNSAWHADIALIERAVDGKLAEIA